MQSLPDDVEDGRDLFASRDEIIYGVLPPLLEELSGEMLRYLALIKRSFRYSGTPTDLEAEEAYKRLKRICTAKF
jgi:hypothetical protein